MDPVVLSAYRINLAVDVAGRASRRLYQRAVTAQEAFLVSIYDGDKGYLGQIQAFPQQVHPDQNVVLSEPQVSE